MTWIKLDDKAPRHPKIAGLSDRAFRWWVLALCYASEFLTDGILPATFWKNAPKQARAELTGAGLWVWTDPVFQIHDYLAHQQSREAVETERRRNRDRRRLDRGTPERRTGGTTDGGTTKLQRPDTETDVPEKQIQTTTPSLRPLVSGEANPRTWGKIHSEHVTGFCDWVCLPEFLFNEFVRKSAGHEYVKGWARRVRERFEGQDIGDNLKFWRARWDESHPEKPATQGSFDGVAAATERLRAAGRIK